MKNSSSFSMTIQMFLFMAVDCKFCVWFCQLDASTHVDEIPVLVYLFICFCHQTHYSLRYAEMICAYLPSANEVWGKVICLQVFVCPQGAGACSRGGVCSGRGCLLQGVGVPAPGGGGCLLLGVSAVSGGCLSPGWGRGVCSWGGVPAPGGVCCQRGVFVSGVGSGGLLLGGVCLVETPHGYCCGRYASYWNAFLLFLYSQEIRRCYGKCGYFQDIHLESNLGQKNSLLNSELLM